MPMKMPTSIEGNRTIVLDRGSIATVNLLVHGAPKSGSLSLTFADSESFRSKPSNLTFSVPSTSLVTEPSGETKVSVTISAAQSLKPGTYFAILTATDGLTYESSLLKILVPS